MFDLDVFVKEAIKVSVLEDLFQKFKILYTKPSFEFWILLHLNSKLSCYHKNFIKKVEFMEEDEIRNTLTNHDNARQMMSGKRITEFGIECLENNLKQACEISKNLLDDVDSNLKVMNIHNYQKILSCNKNISNIHTLFEEIAEHLKLSRK